MPELPEAERARTSIERGALLRRIVDVDDGDNRRRMAASDAARERPSSRFRRYGDHAGLAFWLFVTRDWVE